MLMTDEDDIRCGDPGGKEHWGEMTFCQISTQCLELTDWKRDEQARN